MMFRYLTFFLIIYFVGLTIAINCITKFENEYPKNDDFHLYNIRLNYSLIENFGLSKCAQNPIKFLESQYPEKVQINILPFCVPMFIKIENNIKLIFRHEQKNVKVIQFTTTNNNNSENVLIDKLEDWQYFLIKYSDKNLMIIRDERDEKVLRSEDNVIFNAGVTISSTTEDNSKLKFQQYDAYEINTATPPSPTIKLESNTCVYMAWRPNDTETIQINGDAYMKKDMFWSITKTCCDTEDNIPITFKEKGFLVKNSIMTQYKKKTVSMRTTEARKTISTTTEMTPENSETNIIIYSSISIIVLALIVIGAFVFICMKRRRSTHYDTEKDYVRVNDLYCKPDDLTQLETNNIYSEIN